MKECLFVVDMINGFVKEGAMHDEKIMNIVPDIIQLCNKHEHRIFIQDMHEKDAIEFKSFPTHCLKDTSESAIIDELKPYVKETIHKNSTNTFHALDKKILEEYDSFVICGCCSDICVMQFALSLKTYLNHMNMDKQVHVPRNCIATYDALNHPANDYHKMALNMMAQSGINIDEMR